MGINAQNTTNLISEVMIYPEKSLYQFFSYLNN